MNAKKRTNCHVDEDNASEHMTMRTFKRPVYRRKVIILMRVQDGAGNVRFCQYRKQPHTWQVDVYYAYALFTGPKLKVGATGETHVSPDF